MTKAPTTLLSMRWLGKPVPKGRPRMTRDGHTYNPPATAKFEKKLKAAVKKRWGKGVAPSGASLEVLIKVDRGVPLSWSKKRIRDELWNGKQPHGPGDLDNIAKSILDAMNGVIFDDDKQVVKLSIRRQWAEKDGFEIVVREAQAVEIPTELIHILWARKDRAQKAKQAA